VSKDIISINPKSQDNLFKGTDLSQINSTMIFDVGEAE
jgi:hypothetical protein